MKEYELLNGNMVPALAYGTWLIKNENAANCVKMALEAGYRHIDTAQAYGNEEGVGIGMRESGLKREDNVQENSRGTSCACRSNYCVSIISDFYFIKI